jgi:hypothetical protein
MNYEMWVDIEDDNFELTYFIEHVKALSSKTENLSNKQFC